MATPPPKPKVQPCRYKTGKTLGAGSYSVVKECVHIDTGRYYAAKVINKRLMSGREHMVRNEIAVLKKVSMGHQNILTLVDYFETMNNCAFPVGGIDIWAIGVITYFLLCGYTPFDRDSNLEEMQAILAADYSFTPLEYWRGVSQEARSFINRCLTINPQSRMTAHEALQHPWVNPPYDTAKIGSGEDLLPTVKKNFNARRTLHRAIDTVRAINKLREGGGFMMDGVMSVDPKPERVNGDEIIEEEKHAAPAQSADHAPGGQIDSRGNARGQSEEQIRAQERRVKEMVAGLWSRTPR
ncbi:hypothetical protein N7508_008910 [Penicillium antarcticum]|uniref:uncharacterized protein n=1 Tax=Penicillium antarcticum TaxID=416450 RepID=UPI00239712D0|nr:uncharacterized protein N7508_008910 [Penicillium antarcticum]KAJ5294089.1 hypothetical protein N7508_008910 [Penicillium antarcticum]